MANKHSSKDKHKKKHKKEKSKKHKKEKKHKKHEKEKSRSKKELPSSSSASSSDSEVDVKDEVKQETLSRPEWGLFDAVLNDSNVTIKNKKVKETRSEILDKPGQSSRELNPYWKDGGCGLPPTAPRQESRNYDGNSRKTLQKDSLSYRSAGNNQRNSFSDNREKKFNFLKPGEGTSYGLNKNTFQRNWKKKELKEPDQKNEERSASKEVCKNDEPSTSSKALTNEELNKLAAKLVKAEIMGNTAMINKLKAELEAAKQLKDQMSVSGEKDSEERREEVIVITDSGLKKHYNDEGHPPSKRQKVRTNAAKESYFSDDKYSLKNLFEKEKSTNDEEIFIPTNLKVRNSEEFDDAYIDATASEKVQQKIEDRRNKKSKKDALIKHKTLEGCNWCLDNRNQTKHLIVSTGNKCYLCLPEEESLNKGHCLIVPLQHEISMMHLDEDVWEEVKTYQRVLTRMFLEQGQDVVFFENARSFKRFPHCFVQCVPLDKELGDVAPIYFQKAISESEAEWSTNKKVVDFRQKDLRRSIPKGLPYFAVSFGTEGGFAHIIEDEYLFKRNFAEEVIGGMMDLEPRKWRKPQKENFRAQREKALEFLKTWKKYEFNENSPDSDSSDSD